MTEPPPYNNFISSFHGRKHSTEMAETHVTLVSRPFHTASRYHRATTGPAGVAVDVFVTLPLTKPVQLPAASVGRIDQHERETAGGRGSKWDKL